MASHVTGMIEQMEQMKWMEYTDFLHIDGDSQKLKAGQKFIGWSWSKMGMVMQVMGL